jgi:phosphomevalonate kinase
MISGEWAVLEVGNPCIVAAVNKRVHVKITDSDEIYVKIKDLGISATGMFDGKVLSWSDISEKDAEKLIFVKAAIEAALQYVGKSNNFSLETWNDDTEVFVDGERKKLGFGTSAAIVVAVVAAVLAFNKMDINKRENKDAIYKLSAMAHHFAQGKVGSAFDVAASTYGGAIIYKRFDATWLDKEIKSGKNVKEIVDSNWPVFHAEELKIPEDFIMLVGWTKESASTVNLVKEMGKFKESQRTEYDRLYGSIASLVKELIPAWKKHDKEKIIELLNRNEIILRELGSRSGVPIETGDLRTLSEAARKVGAAGKLSGAGGGDCGIAACFDEKTADNVKAEWESSGIYIVDATIDRNGVIVER